MLAGVILKKRYKVIEQINKGGFGMAKKRGILAAFFTIAGVIFLLEFIVRPVADLISAAHAHSAFANGAHFGDPSAPQREPRAVIHFVPTPTPTWTPAPTLTPTPTPSAAAAGTCGWR